MAPPAELERRMLGAALLGMAVGALGVGLWLGWQFLSALAPSRDDGAVSTRDLMPGAFKMVDAARPAGGATGRPTKWLLLRGLDGAVQAFELPMGDGRAALPVDGNPHSAGVPCDDIAPDFRSGDIACRQARPGFEFALRHRWSLQGAPLSDGTQPLPTARGVERDGVWVNVP